MEAEVHNAILNTLRDYFLELDDSIAVLPDNHLIEVNTIVDIGDLADKIMDLLEIVE